MKIYRFLIIGLFFTLPLIHGKLFPTVGVNIFFDVYGNFEFTKSMFFNICSSLIFFTYLLENSIVPFSGKERGFRREFGKIGLFIIGVLALSTLFSFSPFISLIADSEKGHTSLLFFNLLGLLFILLSEKRVFLLTCLKALIASGVLISFVAIKELFFATYGYGNLSGRALGTFGHPNYLAGFLLLLIPITSFVSQNILRYILLGLFLLVITLCQSLTALIIGITYISYSLAPAPLKGVMGGGIIVVGVIIIMFIILYFPEKLHSFLSRFYLWETTLSIMIAHPSSFVFGAGLETLPYYFESFKSPELYIYENYGYTADRPHNFFLFILYHFGVFGLSIFGFLVYKFYKTYRNTPENLSIVLFLVYGILHYFSVASFMTLVLCVSLALKSRNTEIHTSKRYIHTIWIYVFVGLSIIGGYYSSRFYYSEILYKDNNTLEASQIFPTPKYFLKIGDYEKAFTYEHIYSSQNIKEQIIIENNKQELCSLLTDTYPSVENFFYCGKIFENIGNTKLAKNYYKIGLKKLPDLWNSDSPYWDRYFIKNTISGNRFFSEKFGDIRDVLEKVSP